MKKIIASALAVFLIVFTLAGCGAAPDGGASIEYRIGISQFAEHGALDDCREGLLEGLGSEGIVEGENMEVQYQNAQADSGTASQIAESLVLSDVDMIAAIATPSAQSALNAVRETEIPVVYTAVSDPAAAGFVNEDGTGTGNITGSSGIFPAAGQLEMIRGMMPGAGRIGILYNISEVNSLSVLAEYERLAPEYGFQIVTTGIGSIADVGIAAANMVTQVDCICNLTDNTVVEELQTLLEKANAQGIPVFGSDREQVRRGCIAAVSVDYHSLGYETGVMAAKILKGEASAQETSCISASGTDLYINKAAADNIYFSIDDSVLGTAKEVFEEITA